ncbi:hypothetical protein HN51_019379 [Arachis hypogaea]
MKNKPCDDVTKKNSSPSEVKSKNCVFTDLSDENKEVEILHNMPPSFYKGTQTCLDGEEKSKPKSRFGIQRNSKTNKTVQELPSKFLRQKDKLARFNNPPSIQNMAIARPAKMPKIEHKGQLSSKMAETRVRKGPLTFTIDKARLTTAAKPKKMAFKNTSIPKNLNCSFKPPQDMRLSEDLVNMAMYIFNADIDIAEDLVHIHDTIATRGDLFCLVPGKQVSELIYVPIKENDHWYLMVMSIPDKILYHLDSHCKVEDDEPRKHHIRNIVKKYAKCGIQDIVSFEGWEVGNAIGIPRCTNSNDSAVWVMQWMDVQQEFTPVIPPKLHEEMSRMYLALDFVTGDWNKIRADVNERFQLWWIMIHP